MSDALTIGDFAPHLHTQFQVAQQQGYELELTEVTDYSNAQLEQFSLIFTGAASPWLQQGLHTLIHQEIAQCELFLVPLGPDAAGMHYQAVFSRFRHVIETGAGIS